MAACAWHSEQEAKRIASLLDFVLGRNINEESFKSLQKDRKYRK
jgi:hypothetical protein